MQAKQSYAKPPCGIKIHPLETVRARHSKQPPRSQTANPELANRRDSAQAELKMKEQKLARLAEQEAELDRRENELRSNLSGSQPKLTCSSAESRLSDSSGDVS